MPRQAHGVAVQRQKAAPGDALVSLAQALRKTAVGEAAQLTGFQQVVLGARAQRPVGALAQHGQEFIEVRGLGVNQRPEARPAADERFVRHLQRHARRVFLIPEQVVHRTQKAFRDQRAQVGAAGARAQQLGAAVHVDALLRIQTRVGILEGKVAEQVVELFALGRVVPLVERFGPVFYAGAQGVDLVVQRRTVAARGGIDGARQVFQRDAGRHRHVHLFAFQRRFPQPRQQVLQERQVVGVVGDGLHVVQKPLQHRVVKHHLLGQRVGGVVAARHQAQKALCRAGDGATQLGLVQAPDQVGRLVDGIGQFQERGAVVEVFAAHRQHDMATRVRAEEVVQHPFHQQLGVFHVLVGGVEDFFELVQHKEHARLGRVGAGWHVKITAVGVQQARKACFLAEDRGNFGAALGIGSLAAARAQERCKAPRQPRDGRMAARGTVFRGHVGAGGAGHGQPEVARAGDAVAAQFGHHAGVDQAALARPRAAQHRHKLRLAQVLDDFAHLPFAAEEQRRFKVEKGPQAGVRLARQAAAGVEFGRLHGNSPTSRRLRRSCT